jgi:hypothetical protein
MDNPEKLVTLEGAIKHGQSRETGYIGRGNQTWTIQRNWLHWTGQSNMDNPEKLVTLEGAIKHGQSRETGYI